MDAPTDPTDWTDPLAAMAAFRVAKGMITADTPTLETSVPPRSYVNFMSEEAKEMGAALDARDIAAVADALCDQSVFTLHAVCDFGLRRLYGTLMREVYASNMTKDLPGKGGKMVKGPGYVEPRLWRFFGGSALVRVSCWGSRKSMSGHGARALALVRGVMREFLERYAEENPGGNPASPPPRFLDGGPDGPWGVVGGAPSLLAAIALECGYHRFPGAQGGPTMIVVDAWAMPDGDVPWSEVPEEPSPPDAVEREDVREYRAEGDALVANAPVSAAFADAFRDAGVIW